VSVYLTGHNLHRLPARAGQFFNWRFLDGPGWSRAHPYSLSAAPRRDWLRITVKDVDGSGRLARLRPGTRVLIEGPYGALTGARRQRSQVLLAAAGVGITPLRALLDELATAPGMLLAAAGTAALATVEPRCCIVWCLTFITTTSTCVGPRHGLRHCAPASPAPGSPRRRCIPSSSPGRER
jgi:hypothetical protein